VRRSHLHRASPAHAAPPALWLRLLRARWQLLLLAAVVTNLHFAASLTHTWYLTHLPVRPCYARLWHECPHSRYGRRATHALARCCGRGLDCIFGDHRTQTLTDTAHPMVKAATACESLAAAVAASAAAAARCASASTERSCMRAATAARARRERRTRSRLNCGWSKPSGCSERACSAQRVRQSRAARTCCHIVWLQCKQLRTLRSVVNGVRPAGSFVRHMGHGRPASPRFSLHCTMQPW
jgi:hypothetical protein